MARALFSLLAGRKAPMALWNFAGLFPLEKEAKCLFWPLCGLGHPPKLVGRQGRDITRIGQYSCLYQSSKLKKPCHLSLASFINHLENGDSSLGFVGELERGCNHVSDSV